MITLAGFTPDEDIEIRYVGLRPGEKLFEELQQESEDLVASPREKIRTFRGSQVAMEALVPWMTELQHLLWARDGLAAIEHMKKLVPEYQGSAAQVREQVAQAAHDARADVPGAALVESLEAAAS
jgi:FlaA1/EpsC-like NDP-sugar epimerase